MHHDFGPTESIVHILEGLWREGLEDPVNDLLDELVPLLAALLVGSHQIVPALNVGWRE